MQTHSHRYGVPRFRCGLGSSAMTTKAKVVAPMALTAPTVGQRLIAALVPQHFPTLTALQMASGVAYSTLSNWKNGSKAPDLESVEAMARLVKRDPLELLGTREGGSTTALHHHRDFDKALAAAEQRFPGRLPRLAYQHAGTTSAAQWPETIDAVFLFDLASFWWKHASNAEAMDAEEASVRAEMAAVDAKRKR